MRSPYRSLPGSGPAPRGLFVDRWGTLIQQPKKGFMARFDPAKLIPRTVDALFHAAQAGWTIYLLGNEDSVAFGKQKIERWKAFEQDLLDHLGSSGVPVQRNYACTDNPEGVAPNNRDSVFFLPNTGAMYHASQMDGVSLADSWVVGDSTLELVAGWRAGCRIAGVRTGLALEDCEYPVDPEIVEDDLAATLHEITTGLGQQRRSAV